MAHEQQPGPRRNPHDLVHHESYIDPRTGFRHDSTILPLPPDEPAASNEPGAAPEPEAPVTGSGKMKAIVVVAILIVVVISGVIIGFACR